MIAAPGTGSRGTRVAQGTAAASSSSFRTVFQFRIVLTAESRESNQVFVSLLRAMPFGQWR